MEAWRVAVSAAESKQADDVSVLDLRQVAGFTDTFVICTGRNPRQNQAISDDVEKQLKQQGIRPIGIEGYQQAEWILLDYGDLIVHIFSRKARDYYDLERLWRAARPLDARGR